MTCLTMMNKVKYLWIRNFCLGLLPSEAEFSAETGEEGAGEYSEISRIAVLRLVELLPIL